jgi:type I restriction enzyme S subunit
VNEYIETELGTIPKNWHIKPIGDMAFVTKLAGYEYTKFFKYIDDGEIIALRALNVREGFLDLTQLKRISKQVSNALPRSKLIKGDILFTYVGANIGQFALINEDNKYHLAPNICLIRSNKDCDAYFIYSYLRTIYFKDNLPNYCVGSSQPTLPMGNIRKILLPCPPIAEQKAIASIISGFDNKISLLNRQNKTLESIAKTLFRQWFVEEAQDNWTRTILGDVLASIESGSRPKGGIDQDLKFGIPSIGAENINGLGTYMFTKTKFITHEFFQSMKRGVVQDFDVLIYKDGAYVGKKAMFGKGYPFDICCVNEHVFILRANEKVTQFFLYFLLQENDLASLNTNTAQPGLNQESMKSFEITLPPIDLINSFSNSISPLIVKIFENSKQIQTLEKLRDNLLPKLVSGELRTQND